LPTFKQFRIDALICALVIGVG
jgi:hypothetical protein